ncbi:hypothetical protein ACPCSF_04865 [Streptomyces griseoincarnatus]
MSRRIHVRGRFLAGADHPGLIEYFTRLGVGRAENGRHSGVL